MQIYHATDLGACERGVKASYITPPPPISPFPFITFHIRIMDTFPHSAGVEEKCIYYLFYFSIVFCLYIFLCISLCCMCRPPPSRGKSHVSNSDVNLRAYFLRHLFLAAPGYDLIKTLLGPSSSVSLKITL